MKAILNNIATVSSVNRAEHQRPHLPSSPCEHKRVRAIKETNALEGQKTSLADQRLGCKHWILDAPAGQRGRILKEGEMLSKFKMRLAAF